MPAKHDPHSNVFVNYDAKETPIEQLFSKEIEKKTETGIHIWYIYIYTCTFINTKHVHIHVYILVHNTCIPVYKLNYISKAIEKKKTETENEVILVHL